MTLEPDAAPGDTPPLVAVIGGGIAGMTAALRLAQRGFAVELFEARAELGGNMASVLDGGLPRDVYPHMFCDWYANFWDLFENDLGLSRADHFRAFDGVHLIEPDGRVTRLLNPTDWASFVANLECGPLPPAEMFLTMFSLLDLAGEPMDGSVLSRLGQLDVNGFIYDRPYATQAVATLNDYILTTVWSLSSAAVAARSYQDFLRHFASFPRQAPFAWLLRRSSASGIIDPLAERLRAAGVVLHTAAPVTALGLVGERARVVVAGEARDFDHAVVATPAAAMLDLMMSAPPEGSAGVIEQIATLAPLQTARTAAIPVVHLWLKRRLPGVPEGQVGLHRSSFGLSFCDLSQLWAEDADAGGATVLSLAASRPEFIPARGAEAIGHAMLVQAAAYLPGLRVGARWGDPDSDVDWTRSCVRLNQDHRLFVNDVESLPSRPRAAHIGTKAIVLAGDYCLSGVGMATVEAAVQTGISAARAVQMNDQGRTRRQRGSLIEPQPEVELPATTLLALRLALLPVAYAATAWARASGSAPLPADIPGGLSDRPADHPLDLPVAFVQDWWSSALTLLGQLASAGQARAVALETMGAALALAGDLLERLAAAQGAPAGSTAVGAGATLMLQGLAQMLGAAGGMAAGTMPDPSAPPHRRRWRAKP